MIAILGGGITALSAALKLQKAGKEFILLEVQTTCGGKIQSKEVEGYTLEMGPNTVLINNAETKEFISELGLWNELIFADQEAVRNRFVLKKGRLEQIPTSIKSAFQSNLFTLKTFGKILTEPFKKANTSEQDESLADFSRRRLGKQIYEDLITPFVSGIYAGDPEKMSINHTLYVLKEAEQTSGSILRGMPKILKKRKEENAHWNPPKNKIFSFKGGLRRMIQVAEEKLSRHIQYGCQVLKIEKLSPYSITYIQEGKTKTIEVDSILSTIPATVLAEIIGDKALAKNLKKVNYVPAIVTHLGISKEQLIFNKKAFGVLSRKNENVPFLGVLFNTHFFPHSTPNNKALLTIISGGYKNPEMVEMNSEQIVESIVSSLNQLEILKGKAELSHVLKWRDAIPQYELNYDVILSEIDRFQKENSNFFIAGNFYKGISVSDCIANGANLAAQIH